MAKSDLILSLVRAGTSGDQNLFRKTVEALIADERAQQHNVLADNLARSLAANGNGPYRVGTTISSDSLQTLFYDINPRRKLSELVLSRLVQRACEEIIEEQNRADLLRSHNLEPRNRILLIGPSGNGKTSLAEAVAEALMVPLIRVRYEGVIGSFLGETAGRLRRLFEYVSTRHCVLFFDEFDTLGKERGDPHDTGEIKRVVSSLLLQIDDLPSHVVVVTATNHPELLDRAVWRRFQIRLNLPRPTRTQVRLWFERFRETTDFPLSTTPKTLAQQLNVVSFSELEEFCSDILRRWLLSLGNGDHKEILRERLLQWNARASAQRR
ncbi:MAG: ATP-binding protein [Acidobacteria bacterium]|nr:ATP-binding protein [Acidobacteriota bacterium]